MPKRRITEHFTMDELVFSQTALRLGIDNTPTAETQRNLVLLARFLEDVRALLGDSPLVISSGYRSPALNQRIGGSLNSAHMSGLAADFTVPAAGTVLQVCRVIERSGLGFEQLIHEFGGWVHLAIPPAGRAASRRVNSIFAGTGYMAGIRPKPTPIE
ncbi:D-Ala-D-Ala carboxypeptidase family metallohydrolase [Usitatibacter palustris]|uniref:Peptidase M15A C-terminal domain-containing protein n=1 Tax=Usitatibacter palustris TaxID=2732487 RepID=A0A6M4HBL9_9PROT|nr:D-Ala-D-Ala carboxypeptidase family metallohydrolase [Usitatibacter palustris]QJR15357.1 hypothetical protein DSM104440_02176 [Usitatibacter palustris]